MAAPVPGQVSVPVPVPLAAGLCAACRYVSRNETKRGTVYFRCTRAQWDDRLVKYPRLPVVRCVGFEAAEGIADGGESTSA